MSEAYTLPVDPARAGFASSGRSRLAYGLQLPISERRLLLIVGDVVASAVAVVMALALWAMDARYRFDGAFVTSQIGWLIVLPALWVLLARVNDYYDLRVAAHVGASLRRLALIVGETLVAYLATFFLSPPGSLPRLFIVYYAALSLVLIGLWRAARIFLIGWTGFRRRALVVGVGREAEVMLQALKIEAAGDYEVMGIVASEQELPVDATSQWYVGSGADLPRLVAEYGVSELVMAYSGDMPTDVFKGLLACYELGAQVTPMARLYEQVTGRIPIEHVSEQLWTLVLPDKPHSLGANLYAASKRALDLLLAVVGLVVFALLLPALALAIKIGSPGPVFYTQTRLGKSGAPFQIFKLRTMVVNAEAGSGPQWAKKKDSRITGVGRFLRRTRLDEAPQLLNVLRGEMSIVGPRPERPEFIEPLAAEMPFYRARLAVRPGLTGWAQVRYPYGNTREDALRKLQYDLYYIRHQSLLMDITIVLKTVGVMLTFQGL